MRKLVIGAIVVLAFSSAAVAQPGGRGGFGRGGFGFGRGGPVALLQREDVQKELDISKDQLEEIEEVARESRGGRGRGGRGFGNFREMSEAERAEAMAEFRAQQEKQTQETREKLDDILSREQSKRLSQLEFQYALRQGSVDGAISAGRIEVSQRDRDKLRDVQREVGEETRAKIAKIQREAQIEILKTLVSEAEIEELSGEAFEFAAQSRGFGRDRQRDGDRSRGRDRGRGERRGRPESDDDSGGDRRGRRR